MGRALSAAPPYKIVASRQTRRRVDRLYSAVAAVGRVASITNLVGHTRAQSSVLND